MMAKMMTKETRKGGGRVSELYLSPMMIAGLAIMFLYGTLVLWMDKKFARLRALNLPIEQSENQFSIIIPCRNEAHNLDECMSSVLSQEYPKDQYEIILVDDHSEDGTFERMTQYALKYTNVLAVKLSQETGKKAALATGIREASKPWVVTRDADTRCGKEWLATLSAYIDRYAGKDIWIMPVHTNETKGFWNLSFGLEFLSLVISGLAFATASTPIMANGANLAFRRKVFDELGGYDSHVKLSSGDDQFLVMDWQKRHKGHVGCIAQREAAVTTPVPSSFSEWLTQRIRWGSKFSRYGNSWATWVGVLVMLTNLALIVMTVSAILGSVQWGAVAFAWIVKLVPDLLFLQNGVQHYDLDRLMLSFLPLSILLPFLMILTFFMSLFTRPSWKGRKISV